MYIRRTPNKKQYCHGGNLVECKLGLFQDADFAVNLTDSKSTSGGVLYLCGSHTVVPISWACEKLTALSHTSTESENLSLDTGLRMEDIPAVNLRDTRSAIMDILHSQAGGVSMHVHHTRIPKHQELFGDIDYVLPNARLFRMRTSLHIFEDNEVLTKLTKQQMAVILTKGPFTGDRWSQLTLLVNIMTRTTLTRSNLSVSSAGAGESFATPASAKQKPSLLLSNDVEENY